MMISFPFQDILKYELLSIGGLWSKVFRDFWGKQTKGELLHITVEVVLTTRVCVRACVFVLNYPC